MRVLIVDDDAAMREALCDTLELQGHRTAMVANGREALEHLEHSDLPCLILLDLMMPLMNGWEFREAQLKDPLIAAIPVVVISAHADPLRNADKLAAAGYLIKPVDPGRLLQAVAEWCRPAL
ncbi:MAG: response regulator [Acidobacteriota bacterium]